MNTLINGQQHYVNVSFSQLDISNSQHQQLIFEDCHFEQCNFSYAQLTFCQFIDCSFSHANLSLAQLIHCSFSSCRFNACKLVGVDWTRIAWSNLSTGSDLQFYQSKLNESSFHNMQLACLVIDQCQVHGVDFREAKLNNSRFVDSDFYNSLFLNTKLSCVDFTGSTNYYINLLNNDISEAKFSRLESSRLLELIGLEIVD